MQTFDVVGCEAVFWICALERIVSDPTTWLLTTGIVVGCLVLLWLQYYREFVRDAPRLEVRPSRTTRVVAGPELRDGSWVRLVEFAPGQMRAEIYVDRRWIVMHRDPSKFFEAAPRDRLRLTTR